ncbi:hypothetical protein Bbelb_372400 [Branchiostoma belcheri]|nr:hypothetical protein Bbelb_372400 [Branchiostoma belcheri]
MDRYPFASPMFPTPVKSCGRRADQVGQASPDSHSGRLEGGRDFVCTGRLQKANGAGGAPYETDQWEHGGGDRGRLLAVFILLDFRMSFTHTTSASSPQSGLIAVPKNYGEFLMVTGCLSQPGAQLRKKKRSNYV